MRHTKHNVVTVLIPALMLLVWACGGDGSKPPTRVAQAAEALPAQPVENAPVSTTELSLLPPSTADIPTTAAELEPNNTPAAMPRPPVTYLEETIPLCTPIGQGREDPCEAEPPPGMRTSGGSSLMSLLPEVMPTISELVIQELTPSSAPHMVVRATGIPGTARCDGLYPVKTPDFRPDDERLKHSFRYYCFTDFRINEYIIGNGPPTLTLKMTTGRVSLLNPEDWKTVDLQSIKEIEDFPGPDSVAKYEGREYVIMIGVATNLAVEHWAQKGYYYSMWQIVRDGDELRAVSTSLNRLARTPEQRQALNRPLNDVLQEIIEAVETRTTVNEGRIGPDPDLPNIITDANNLQDYYKVVGLVYEGDEATVLPPPVPGAETPSPTPDDDDAATTTHPTAEETTATTQLHTQDTTPRSTETAQLP